MWGSSTFIKGHEMYARCLLSYLCRGAVELLQAVLQPLHLAGQVFALLAQQAAVQLDLLQEGLGRGVVVAPLVGQILPGLVVDARVDVRHELTD